MKNVLILAAILMASLLSACGQQGEVIRETTVLPAPIVPPSPPAIVDPIQEDLNAVLKEENDYRSGLGQSVLSQGLACTVQALGAGQWLSSASPGYNAGQGVVAVLAGSSAYAYLYKGLFNQPDSTSGPNILLPNALQPMFLSNNYKISCSGQIIVLETGYYSFDLNSDDGSILTVNGTQVINNDGNHAMTAKTGTVFLRRGVRTFSILYAQTGAGNFGLVLKANGASIEGRFYAH